MIKADRLIKANVVVPDDKSTRIENRRNVYVEVDPVCEKNGASEWMLEQTCDRL